MANLLAIWLLSTSTAASVAPEAVPERTPKKEVELLMSEGLPFAESMLREHGEFYPFATVMRAEGKIQAVGITDGEEHPDAVDVLERLLESLERSALEEGYRATAVFVHVEVPRPPDGAPVTAVQVALEHRSGYCVDVFYPYAEVSGRVELGEPFATARDGAVFGSCE